MKMLGRTGASNSIWPVVNEACPKCKSDQWKSAKLVVLEGTTVTDGRLAGNLTDPGRLSGGVREFLLSDRWFSWDHKIDAGVELRTRSALVDEVKRVLVEAAQQIPKIVHPGDPPPEVITKPSKPSFPEAPAKPIAPTPTRWYAHFAASMKTLFLVLALGMVAVLIFWTAMSVRYIQLSVLLLGLGIPINFIRSFSGDKRASLAFAKAEEAYSDETIKYNIDIRVYENRLRRYEEDCKKADEERAQHAIAVNQYEQRLARYREEEASRLLARDALWERARLCTRCGTAYIGTPS